MSIFPSECRVRLCQLIVILFIFTSCQRTKIINPIQPEETYTQVSTQPVSQLSVINVPVTIPLSELEKQMNKQVKDLIFEDTSLENNEGDNLLLKVWKREPITIQAVNNQFQITVPLRIWAKGGLSLERMGINHTEFKETDCELNVHFVTKVSVNEQWQVQTTTLAKGYDWISKPKIKIGFVELSVASFLDNTIDTQQARIASLLDKQVAERLDIRKYVQKAWIGVQQPFLLSQEYQTWLKLTPTEVLLTPLAVKKNLVTAMLGVKAYSQTVSGLKPEVVVNEQLPALQLVKQMPDKVSIGVSGQVSHAYASQILAEKFVDHTFTFSEGKYEITLTSIDLYGHGENIVVKAGMAGSIEGTVYLKGKPYYDPDTQSVALWNLDYDLDTKNKLIKTANWLAKGKFVRTLQEKLRIPLGERMEEAKELIQSKLTDKQVAKGIIVNAQIQELTPADVYITPETIVALVTAKGKATVKIEGLTE
ncbi:DUF4403 family protein [Rhodocytophaga aerolata]|uniref:DUF4403 family protein n=1 Tax=Rhodocytophaga aerolata TaxID=455078 RepID=A0ABT8R9G0_9BACT|nr:DUF4403 family protein [Rhodocytophaga aerolata]MDO1448717.1 DUF4403 family protein [Rhodocytophaga aerolata]